MKDSTRKPIAIYLPKGLESIIAFLATLYSGSFYTPIDLNQPIARVKNIFDSLQPELVITDIEHQNQIKSISENVLIIDDVLGTPKSDSLQPINHWQQIIDTDPMYVMYTSGSTGNPKGVVISHNAVIDYIEWVSKTFSFDENTRFGNQAPFHFDNSILDIYCTLRNAAECVLIHEEQFLSVKRLSSFLEQYNINTLFWVPSALIQFVNAGAINDCPPKTLEKVMFCGEVMPTKFLNAWRKALPDVQYANLYGPTEITDVCAFFRVNREIEDDEALPIGYACRNTEILVITENNTLVADNELGEICVRGRGLSIGYYGDIEKSSEVFIQNPLNDKYRDLIYRTGDLAKYNDHGELVYIGRKDHQIKHLGHRIELGELEANVHLQEGVENACAIYDETKQQINLVVTTRIFDPQKLYQSLKTTIPYYMLPAAIRHLESMPLNANGKIDRKKVAEILSL